MEIHELEARLRAHLGQTGGSARQGQREPGEAGDWNTLARLIEDIRRESELVGTVPERYPRHVDLVIRFVHAMLPWYTRPLRGFTQRSARAFEEIMGHVAELRRNESRILGRLDYLEQSLQELRAGKPQ